MTQDHQGAMSALEHFREAESLAAQARQLREEAVPGRQAEYGDRVRALLDEGKLQALLAIGAALLSPDGKEEPWPG